MQRFIIALLASGALANEFDKESYLDSLTETTQRELTGSGDCETSKVLAVQSGTFSYLQGYIDTYPDKLASYGGEDGVAGSGNIVRFTTGRTDGSISLTFKDGAFVQGEKFNAHLHRTPCNSESEGGQHYQDVGKCPYFLFDDGTSQCECKNSCNGADVIFDPINRPLATNELWFSGVVGKAPSGSTAFPDGRLVVESSVLFGIPERSSTTNECGQSARDLSIVIHDTPNNGCDGCADGGSGPKMLCADLDVLYPQGAGTLRGRVGYRNPGADGFKKPRGSNLKIIRAGDGTTTASLQWYGLRKNFKYPSHIHAEPCTGVASGGPHYVRNISDVGFEVAKANTDETEFWVGFETDSKGKMTRVEKTIPGIARAGAQSVVLHDCLASPGVADDTGACPGGKPRIACYDFGEFFK